MQTHVADHRELSVSTSASLCVKSCQFIADVSLVMSVLKKASPAAKKPLKVFISNKRSFSMHHGSEGLSSLPESQSIDDSLTLVSHGVYWQN